MPSLRSFPVTAADADRLELVQEAISGSRRPSRRAVTLVRRLTASTRPELPAMAAMPMYLISKERELWTPAR